MLGTTGGDHLGKLSVPEGQNLEEEAAVEDIRIVLDLFLELRDLGFGIFLQPVLGSILIGEPIQQANQSLELLVKRLVFMKAFDLIEQGIVARKSGREDDTRVIL